MRKPTDFKIITVKIPPELAACIQSAARAEVTNVSELVRRAVIKVLKEDGHWPAPARVAA